MVKGTKPGSKGTKSGSKGGYTVLKTKLANKEKELEEKEKELGEKTNQFKKANIELGAKSNDLYMVKKEPANHPARARTP